MKLRIVYDRPAYTGDRAAVDEHGNWWIFDTHRDRWRRSRGEIKHKPLRASRMGAPWFGMHRGPWIVGL